MWWVIGLQSRPSALSYHICNDEGAPCTLRAFLHVALPLTLLICKESSQHPLLAWMLPQLLYFPPEQSGWPLRGRPTLSQYWTSNASFSRSDCLLSASCVGPMHPLCLWDLIQPIVNFLVFYSLLHSSGATGCPSKRPCSFFSLLRPHVLSL